MAGMIAFEAVEFVFSEQVDNVIETRPMEAASGMSAESNAACTVNYINNLSDARKFRKA